MSTKVLLVDDHQIFLSGLAELVRKIPGIEIVGVADNGRMALDAIRENRPDVVIMDIAMPDVDGIMVTKKALSEFPQPKIICLSMHADQQLIQGMFQAGAVAYLSKDCELSELITAVDKVMAGETFMSSSVLRTVTESYRNGADDTAVALTEREREVLIMLADGLTTKQIAGKLGLSIKTIGTYREHLMDKLDIRSIAGLTKYALRTGLTNPN